jgi:TPR repeat protein
MDRYPILVYLTDANEQCDAWSELERAAKWFTGKGLPQNEPAARATFDRIHRRGRAFSALCLGFMHENGLAVSRDGEMSRSYYAKAANVFFDEAERGLAASQNNLGFMHARGKGVALDQAQAARLFEAAAQSGLAAAQVNLGLCYLNGWGVPQDDTKARTLFQKATEDGTCPAAFGCLAHMAQQGLAMKKDGPAALGYLRQAAEAGDVESWYELGRAFYLGLGCPADGDTALHWLGLASAEGHAKAQSLVGRITLDRATTTDDIEEAIHLLVRSADQGDEQADFQLGQLFMYGTRLSAPQPMMAKEVADRLVGRGSPLGARLLGEMYAQGIGVVENLIESNHWLKLAARQGEPFAQTRLGRHYEEGLGESMDYAEAVAWYRLAEPYEATGARVRLADLCLKLPPDVIRKGESLATERRVRWKIERGFQMEDR